MQVWDYPMISPEEAWQLVASRLRPLPPRLTPLAEALGLVLATDITSTEDYPAFAAATMDGYAVASCSEARVRMILGEQHAGRPDAAAVAPDTAVRIMTGALLPSGADSVVPFELAEETGDQVRLEVLPEPGQNVRQPGHDLTVGQLVLPASTVIGPPEVGLLASLGRDTVLCHPRPRVAIFSTGDELVPADATPAPGQVRDSNGPAVAAAVSAAGGEPHLLPVVEDADDLLTEAIAAAVRNHDMLITSGGVSAGRRDYVKPVLAALGEVVFGRVAQKPGKPMTFALVDRVPVFGLPGFPVSSLVCVENYVRPALRLMSGHTRLRRPEVRVRLTHDVRRDPDRTDLVRATLRTEHGVTWATPTGVQSSSRLLSLVGATALLRIPPGADRCMAGDEVMAIVSSLPEVDA